MKYIIQCKFDNEQDSKFLVKVLNNLKENNTLTPLEIGKLSEAIKTMDKIEDKIENN